MRLSILEVSTVLGIKQSLLRKFVFYKKITPLPRRSLSGDLYYKTEDLKTIEPQIRVLCVKNSGHIGKKRGVKK